MHDYVVLLNWNGWRDTCECLASLMRLNGPAPRVIVCDNASSDGSLDRIRAWARGEAEVELPGWWPAPGQAGAGRLPARRPVMAEVRRADADGESPEGAWDVQGPDDADLFLIPTGANLGFAGGCNVGLRFILQRGDARHVWLLNNDTVVHPDALVALVQEAGRRPQAGMIGSVLRYYHRPDIVQALGGGRFDLARTATMHVGEGERFEPVSESRKADIERQLAYITGASMLLTPAFLAQVGLMQEDYFLYYEEIDWAERARRSRPAFGLALAAGSLIFHKEGASAGTNTPSVFSARLLARNRLRFIRRFYPEHLPSARRHVLRDAVVALLKRRPAVARTLMREALGPVRLPETCPAAQAARA